MTDPADIDYLREAVDKLTHPYTVLTRYDGGAHSKVHDPLIKQLRDMIGSDTGPSSGSSKAANEKAPLDIDALRKYTDVASNVRDFYVSMLHITPARDALPEVLLRIGYVEFQNRYRRGNLSEASYRIQARLWEGVVRMIEAKSSPPTTLELVNDECPVCGFAWYEVVIDRTNRETERRVALTVAYTPDDRGGLSNAHARCGCCETVWAGTRGVRELAYALENPALDNLVTPDTEGVPA